ncbi:hypothetical protein MES4922_310066 [Mesorhizobium ventifaucium]|uniref:Uncharacterized protein n=1 Tax=Mesorhizobium ventifaucium TaxID=666020 RepID=A0ABM9E3P5_9HYPH|nr:hypothetical protein MES4922_310066 [Mesorhizobium ventifaucium]
MRRGLRRPAMGRSDGRQRACQSAAGRLGDPGKYPLRLVAPCGGGALAFPVGLFLARLISLGRHWQVALAAAFVCLLATTIGLTGGLFALQYRSY